MPYIKTARFSHPIQRLIDKNRIWISVDDGIEMCNQSDQADSWEKPRRLVVVRRKVEQDDKTLTAGKTWSLFPEDEIHRNYRYSAYFTNQEISATEAALLWVMFAYNLMSIFRLFVLQEKTQKTGSTWR
jgi:hypothetical protein